MKNLLFQNGDILPLIGLGTYLSKKNEVYSAVLEAIRIGYRHIDCAYIYGNEKEIGNALQDAFKVGMVKRSDIFVTSKLWNSDHAPERVEIAIRKSLNDLQLDYLDLYLIHWPVAFKTGQEQAIDASDLLSPDEMPISITWKEMEKIQKAGLTKHIGVSNFNIPKLRRLIDNAEIKPEVNQIELHPYFQQNEIIEFSQKNKILLTAYSPLGSSHLVHSDTSIISEKLIIEIAEKYSCSPTQVVLAWGMQRGTAVIPKSVNLLRIQENFRSLNIALEMEEMLKINKLERGMRIANGLYVVLPGGCYSYENIWYD